MGNGETTEKPKGVGRERMKAWLKMVLFPKLLLFGDSHTQQSFSAGGWGASIADHFQRKCDVLNRGFSGYTSAFNKLILPKILQNDNTPQGSIVASVILLGSNDSVLEGIDRRSLTVEQYIDNMSDIIQQLILAGLPKCRIFLVSPPPVYLKKWSKHVEEMEYGDVNISHERTKSFSAACVALGEKVGVRVLDFCSLMLAEKDWPDMLDDGLHLSPKGSQFLALHLIPLLESELASLPLIYPDWKDVDPSSPEKSLKM